MKDTLSISEIADILSVSKRTVQLWVSNGRLKPQKKTSRNGGTIKLEQLRSFPEAEFLFKDAPKTQGEPIRPFKVAELFAGAGGLALGLEQAGLDCALLNEIDTHAVDTLRLNRPNWNVIPGNVANIDFTKYAGTVEVVTGGFPCQAFSYAGRKMGFKDARGTLFFQYARAVSEIQPVICVAENVRGLLSHDKGRTISGMISVLDELGYKTYPPQLMKTMFFRVPQKRERLLLVSVRKDIIVDFVFPSPYPEIFPLKEALKKGLLFDSDVPGSQGVSYPARKKKILSKVPPGGYWRNLPDALQREYMKGSYFLGGGKTGMARRMSWDEPCLTLTCNPAQKQTERCHPEDTRPFTVREYARIQTFPDSWRFSGSLHSQYKQIGNAVPVNFAKEIGHAIVQFLNNVEATKQF